MKIPPPFTQTPNHSMDGLNLSEAGMLLWLWRWANEEDSEYRPDGFDGKPISWHSLDKMLLITNTGSKATLIKILNELERMERIKIHKSTGEGNIYEMLLPKNNDIKKTKIKKSLAKSYPQAAQNSYSYQYKKCTATSTDFAPPPVQNMHPNYNKITKSINNLEKEEGSAVDKKLTRQEKYSLVKKAKLDKMQADSNKTKFNDDDFYYQVSLICDRICPADKQGNRWFTGATKENIFNVSDQYDYFFTMM